MAAPEEVLSLDIGEHDILYRVRRGDSIVYVQVNTLDLIPISDRTDSSRILRHLRKLPVWQDAWQTLRIEGPVSSLQFSTSSFKPHGLASATLRCDIQRYDLLRDLTPVERVSDRIFKAHQNDKIVVVKIARFSHEVQYLQQELQAYDMLWRTKFTSMPQLYGYLFEEHDERVVGFVMQHLDGQPAGPGDLADCRAVLKDVHASGLLHGDVNRYNFMKTDSGMKIFDFEDAHPTQSQASQDKELLELEEALHDLSGRGRR